MDAQTARRVRSLPSLRAQVLLILVVAVGVTTFLSTTVFSQLFAEQFEKEVRKRGQATVQTLEKHADLRLALALADDTHARPVLNGIAAGDEDVQYVAVLGPKKNAIAWAPSSVGRQEIDAAIPFHFGSSGGGQTQRFTQTVVRAQGDTAGGELEFPVAQAEGKPDALGYIVLGLSSGKASARLTLQTLATAGLTGVILILLFLAYFRWVTRRLDEMVQFAERVAEGDLTRTLADTYGDDIGRLAAALQEMSGRTQGVIKQLQSASRALSSSSSEILDSSSRQAANATKQAAAVAEMGATVTELREIFKQATAKTESVIDLANKSEHASSSGAAAVKESVGGMDQIREHVVAMAKTMEGLARRADQIGAIIEVVKDISEQSRMLALNAGIEAVRSGEHGRGFAVVAREMRSLADRSKESTDQVRSILQDIQVAVRNAVVVSEEGQQRAEAGMKVATAAGGSIVLLADTIAASSRAATQIAAATRQQGAGVEQIWQASRDIDRAANETAAGIQQLEKAAGNMKQLADGMSDVVGRYRI